ncbi:MAG: aminotransferase class V-fold PLP-dependent enzyme, partial [Planctomycetota bacterium]
ATATDTLPVPIWDELRAALEGLGDAPLSEERCAEHLRPLFTRTLQRGGIYLGNHSLGRPLDRTAVDIAGAVDLWYTDMDDAWGAWMEAQRAYRAGIARMIGAPTDDCVVPKTNAGQGLRAVLNAMVVRRPNVVSTRTEFDSVDIILKTYRARDKAGVTFIEAADDGRIDPDALVRAINYATDLVVVSHISYATGRAIEDLERIVKAVHSAHAAVVLDTYHSAGVVPMDLDALGVDYAIGGNYKYTRGGPGACWLMVHPRHSTGKGAKHTLDTGWFAKENVFDYTRHETPRMAQGGDGWLESTPPFLLPYQANAGIAFTLGVGLERLRAYSLEQLAYLRDALASRGVPTHLPEHHGAFLMVPDEDAAGLCARLKSEHDLTADARRGYARFCPDVLTTRAEMDEAADLIARAVGV